MRPHSQHLHAANVFENLVGQPMLDVDAARKSSRQISDKFFVGGRILEAEGDVLDLLTFASFRSQRIERGVFP